MGKKGSKFLALFMVLAMIVTYSFSMSILSVYADDEQGEVNAKANASEDATPAEPESKPDPKPEPTPDPDPPAPTEPSTPDTPDPGQSGGDSSGTGSDTGGSTDADTNSDSGDENDTSSESDDAVVDEATMTGELIEGVVEEEEEEVEYPEVTLHANAGGISVTLHAPEGALPEGSKLSASRVNSQAIFDAVAQRVETEETEMVDAVAIDVTPLDKDGHAVQPKKAVTVTFSGTGLEGGDIDVFRVSDDAGSVTQMGTSIASANKQQFSTNHFTIYVSASSTGIIDEDHNGANNGAAQARHYVLEYGDTITLNSDKSYWPNTWSVSAGGNYIQWDSNSRTVKNINGTSNDINATIRHDYVNNLFDYGPEYFYITLKPQKFKVSFYLKDVGSSEFTLIPEDEGGVCEVYRGQTATAPELSETKDGHKLYSWYTDESCETKATLTNITANKDVYAMYTTDAKIQYFKNTSDAATVPDDQESGVGTKVVIGDATRAGHALTSWNTKPDGSGTKYAPGASVTMPEGGLKLYAQWDESELNIFYHVTNNPKVTWRTQVAPNNGRIALIEEMPTRANEVFLGWGSRFADEPTFYPGDTIDTGNEAIHLYAVWGNHSLNGLYTLKANSRTVTYNGEEQVLTGGSVIDGSGSTVSTWDADDNFVYVGRTAIFRFGIYADVRGFKASGVDAGQYATPVSAPLYYRESIAGVLIRIDTALYSSPHIEIEGGILTIKPVDVEVSTESAEKPFDNTALTKGGTVSFKEGEQSKSADFTPEGGAVTLVHDETLNIRATGSQTEIGESENGYEVDWGKPEDWGESASTAKPYNYNIKSGSLGTLTVYAGVTFDENAGGDTVTNMPKNLKITDMNDAMIPSDVPARSGYNFLGWALKDSATKADFQPGDKLTEEDLGKGLTLYAVWEKETPTPTPSGDDTPGEGGGNGDGGDGDNDGAAAAANIAAAADALNAEIDDNATPEAATINDNAAPKSAPTSHWALLNLIAAILTIIGSLIAAFRKNSATTAVKGVGLAAAAAGVIVFFATQSLGAPMQIADGWTILMAALFGVQCVTTGITAKTPVVDD